MLKGLFVSGSHLPTTVANSGLTLKYVFKKKIGLIEVEFYFKIPDEFRQLVPPSPSPAGVLPQGQGELESGEGLWVTVQRRHEFVISLRLIINVQ